MIAFISNIGYLAVNVVDQAIRIVGLMIDTLYYIVIGPFIKKAPKYSTVLDQMVFSGIQSFPITFFVALFTGIVIAMQSAYQLKVFGAEIFTASMVSVSMARELSPVLTGLVVAGRVGAAITAEISSMKVSEQIEALDAMAISPVRFLVAPRVLALIIMLPCLTILSDIVGIIGGFVVGVFNIGLNAYRYIDMSFEFLLWKDVWTGIAKSFVFGMVISFIGCYMGLNAKGGAEGVGRSTTLSVVTSFILIILFDCLLTGLFYFINV